LGDLEPPAESHDPDVERGGVSSFLNSTRNVIGSITALIVAISGLLIALNKTGLLDGNDDDEPTTETTPTAGLFAPITRPIGRVYFDGETMYVRTAQPGRPLLHLADQEDELDDVSMTARASWVSGARDYGLGFVCRYDSRADYYLIAVLSEGRYNIVRYRDGRPVSLTGGIQRSGDVREDTNVVTARAASAKIRRA
jgi:hypothetical protein